MLLLESTAARFQSDGRTPHAVEDARGEVVGQDVLCRSCVFDITPQRSPPLVRRSCAAGFSRSQSGTKFWLASVQARVTPAVPKTGVVCGIRSDGLVLA